MEIEVEIHKYTHKHPYILCIQIGGYILPFSSIHIDGVVFCVRFLTVSLLLIEQFVATIYEVSNLVIENRALNGSQQRGRSIN